MNMDSQWQNFKKNLYILVFTWLKVGKISRTTELNYYRLYAIDGRRQWQPTPVLLRGKFHGQRSLVGCSPWGLEESDRTEQLHFHFSLSCIGEGNGNPLQHSCLETPRDGRAWWAPVYGVTQSQTRLKRLSSSSSMCYWWPRNICIVTKIPTQPPKNFWDECISICAHYVSNSLWTHGL